MITLPPPPHAHPTGHPRQHGTLVIVIVAQFLVVGSNALFVAGGIILFVAAHLSPDSLSALVFEQIVGLLLPVAILCAVHLAVAVGLLRGQRWGIVLHALVSIGYAAFAVVALTGSGARSVDAQHSMLVLALSGMVLLLILNILAFVNWKRAG